MKIQSLLVKMLPVIVLTTLFILPNNENAFGSSETLLLIDEFAGDTLDSGLWDFETHANNNAQAVVSGGLLTINSGVVNGSGGTVISKQSFTLSEDTLVLKIRAYVSSDFGGSWGFQGPRSDPNRGHLRFGLRQPNPGYLTAIIRPGDNSNPVLIDLSQINPTVWHIYRIEVTNNIARFYVDDQLVTTFSGALPVGVPLHIDLDSASHGSDELLVIDYVRLTLEPLPFQVYLPFILKNYKPVVFSENFNDGELANNPTWEPIQNNAYSIINGELHSDGLIQDQSDRYRNVYRSDVSFQALDYLEFSYQGLLKQAGNPQTGRGTKVNVIGTNGNNYQLNIQRGYVDGFPNDKFSLSLSGGTATTQFDMIVTSFQPEYDQMYDIRTVRQSGIWTLYVDDVPIGTAVDPFGLTDFEAVVMVTVGSVVVDDIVVTR